MLNGETEDGGGIYVQADQSAEESPELEAGLGGDAHFPKYFPKSAQPARREKFPEISPSRLM